MPKNNDNMQVKVSEFMQMTKSHVMPHPYKLQNIYLCQVIEMDHLDSCSNSINQFQAWQILN